MLLQYAYIFVLFILPSLSSLWCDKNHPKYDPILEYTLLLGYLPEVPEDT